MNINRMKEWLQGTTLLIQYLLKRLINNVSNGFKTLLKHLRKAWLAYLLIILAGFFNASMDKMNFHYSKSVFRKFDKSTPDQISFWNPKESWKRKYKDWPTDKSPAFPGAITWGVGFTDGWHLAQGLWILCVFAVPFFYLRAVLRSCMTDLKATQHKGRLATKEWLYSDPKKRIGQILAAKFRTEVYFYLLFLLSYTSSFTFFFHVVL